MEVERSGGKTDLHATRKVSSGENGLVPLNNSLRNNRRRPPALKGFDIETLTRP
jgi:hypothetical protein